MSSKRPRTTTPPPPGTDEEEKKFVANPEQLQHNKRKGYDVSPNDDEEAESLTVRSAAFAEKAARQ